MKPKVLFAGLFHETHTFISEPTPWNHFDVLTDAAILAKEGDESPTAGFLTEARDAGWEVIPTIDARALPSGTVDDEAFEIFWREFERRASPAFAAGLDAIYLVLHGAMATQNIPDAEGEFLERLRALPGAENVPLFGVLDLHANVTARMCRLANGLVAYRENPHTDAKRAAQLGALLLRRCLETGVVPRMAWCRIPLMWAPPGTGSANDPLKALNQLSRKTEKTDPAIWSLNVTPGFSFADTADTGLSLSAIYTGPAERVHENLRVIARLAWELREKGTLTYPSADAVLKETGPSPQGPVLLVEPADNIGGGAPGDGTGILRAFLSHRVPSALLCINDPAAVALLSKVPPGTTTRVELGGHTWAADEGPVKIDVTLVSRSDGAFTLEDAQSHLASMSGAHYEMGPCAVVTHAGITILITSRKTPPFDLGQYRSQGIEPRHFSLIGVKAAVAHRRAYDPITVASHYVDTPGPCSSNLSAFSYHRLARPVYPLDSINEPAFILS